ncbi:MAG: hypothetical protein KDB00_04525 [Planctomycetales bacterium]|nr:hypothetical protein [Planctomycetales bacterium]
MESAEHEMLRSVGIPVLPDADHDQGLCVTWPRVNAACDYFNAARFEDWLDIEVAVDKIGRSSVQYSITFTRLDGASDQPTRIAKGSTVVVCCRLHSGGGLEKVDIPDAVRAKLESF